MEVHVLNVDCLKISLENEYSNLLVMREALIQGPVKAEDEYSFFEDRAIFISEKYKVCTKEDYLKGKDEFEKIKAIKKGSKINFWFGKDVFCQVNFWFLLNFLKDKIDTNEFYLVIPKDDENCSFSNKDKREISFKERTLILKEEIEIFCMLWTLFIKKEYEDMKDKIQTLKNKYPFLKETITALININKVEEEIRTLYLKEQNFEKLFKKICKDYSIYGYGDIQVKYLLNL